MPDEPEFIDFEQVMLDVERGAPERRPPARRRRGFGRGARVALAAAALTALVIPLAASAARGPSSDAPQSFAGPIRVSADGKVYSLRARNTGGGGAARFSCKRSGNDPCVLVSNRDGGPAARFVGGKGAPPFEVDSKVRVDGLNADRLDGRTASQIVKDAIDLGAGDERYKRSWCDEQLDMFDVILPTNAFGMPIALFRRGLNAAKGMVRERPELCNAVSHVSRVRCMFLPL